MPAVSKKQWTSFASKLCKRPVNRMTEEEKDIFCVLVEAYVDVHLAPEHVREFYKYVGVEYNPQLRLRC